MSISQKEHSTQTSASTINVKSCGSVISKCGFVFAGLVFLLFCILIYFPVRDSISRRQLLKIDRTELLDACRQMISNYDSYTNDWRNAAALDRDEKALELWDSKNGYRYETDPRIPEPIRKLKPMYVVVGKDHMYISLASPTSGRIQAYANGALEKKQNYKGERIALTNGLWYWHVE